MLVREGGSESVLRSLKKPVFTAAFSLTGLKSLLIFTADLMGTPLPGTDGQGWAAQCGAGTLFPLRVTSTAEISL